MDLFRILPDGTAAANFEALERKARKASDVSLAFMIDDARTAIIANPDGHKAGFYQDEICVYATELNRREEKQGRLIPAYRRDMAARRK